MVIIKQREREWKKKQEIVFLPLSVSMCSMSVSDRVRLWLRSVPFGVSKSKRERETEREMVRESRFRMTVQGLEWDRESVREGKSADMGVCVLYLQWARKRESVCMCVDWPNIEREGERCTRRLVVVDDLKEAKVSRRNSLNVKSENLFAQFFYYFSALLKTGKISRNPIVVYCYFFCP